jgi:hypothetical protein
MASAKANLRALYKAGFHREVEKFKYLAPNIFYCTPGNPIEVRTITKHDMAKVLSLDVERVPLLLSLEDKDLPEATVGHYRGPLWVAHVLRPALEAILNGG